MDSAPTTLADNLLDDLDDLDDLEDSNEDEEQGEKDAEANEDKANMQQLEQEQDENDDAVMGNDDTEDAFLGGRKPYLQNQKLLQHLHTVQDLDGNDPKPNDDYPLIVQSNTHLAELDDELIRAYTYLCKVYSVKFPELEELLPDPVQYKNAVKVIRNNMDMTLINDELNKVLVSSNQVITISVAGSTTNGRPLTSQELDQVDTTVQYMEDIVTKQQILRNFVQSRMNDLAPNICALLGSTALAAQMLGLAGGLAQLSQIPACNLQVLGQTKKASIGLSKASMQPHQGLLVQCDLVQQYCPKSLHNKALKTVAAKLALAARCDRINVETGRTRTAEAGQKFRAEIINKIGQWQEPDQAPVLKSLPKPDLTIKKRRGGKRMRRLKERFTESSLMKQANTRAFSAATGEYGDDAMGRTRGLLDTANATSGSTNLRTNTAKRPMRYANTKASRQKLAQMQASNPTNGLATSVVFTPSQGMELVNPDRVVKANEKWFGDNAGFKSALPKK